MVPAMFVFGIAPAPVIDAVEQPSSVREDPPAGVSAATATEPEPPVPWGVLKNRRLLVTPTAGPTVEGTFLGLENGYAILEDDDGTIVSILASDVASVRAIKERPAAAQIPSASENMMLVFREEDARIQRRRTERRIAHTRHAAIAGGVIGSLSALSSVIAEGFNIRRWSLSSHKCGRSYYGDYTVCGWTDGADTQDTGPYDYDGYENMMGIAGASTAALPLHVVAGPTILIPSAVLRNRMGDREGRPRQIAAWALWGAGLGSLVANQAVAWTQVTVSHDVCDPNSPNGSDCVYVTPTRGAPPSLYLLSAGLTLSSAILGIMDANDVARRAEQPRSAKTAAVRPTLSVFPVRLQRGGGFGVAGRF